MHLKKRILGSETIVFWDRFTMYDTDEFLQPVVFLRSFCLIGLSISVVTPMKRDLPYSDSCCTNFVQDRSFSMQTNRC